MSKYRKVDPRFWIDERVRGLNEREKLIGLYCITAQSNRVGIFNFSPARAAEDLGMSFEAFSKAFEKVRTVLRYEFDAAARVLYLPTWWKYNQAENEGTFKANLKDLHDLPQTPLMARFFANVEYLTGRLAEILRNFSNDFLNKLKTHPAPVTDPDPASAPDRNQESSGPGRDAPAEPPGPEFTEFYAGYPRHSHREAAEKAWRKLNDADRRAAIDDLPARVAAWKRSGTETQFIPNPATWLNQRRWSDDLPAPPLPTIARREGRELSPGMANLMRVASGGELFNGHRANGAADAANQGLLVPATGRRPDDRGVARNPAADRGEGRAGGGGDADSERAGGAADAGGGLSARAENRGGPRGAAAQPDSAAAGTEAVARRDCAGQGDRRGVREQDRAVDALVA